MRRSRCSLARLVVAFGLVVAQILMAHPALAAGGQLDTSFGGDGKVTAGFTTKADWAIDLAVQPDGRIVAAGIAGYGGSNPKFALARFETDGSPDGTFGGDGMVTTDFTPKLDVANSVTMQPDGKILAVGVAGFDGSNSKFALARYNTNGSLDSTFRGDGKVTTDLTPNGDSGRQVAIQTDGKIVVGGAAGLGGPNPRFALARYRTNGSLDTTFGGDGKVFTDFTNGDDEGYGLVLQADGKIVAGGEAGADGSNSRFALARYKSNGSLDTTFGGDGTVVTDFTAGSGLNRVLIQSDQRVVAAGGANYGGTNARFALARYDTDGALDATFGGDGKVTTDFTPKWDVAFGLAIAGGETIVAGGEAGLGSNPKFALARYETNGALDTTFSGDGKVSTDFTPSEDFANGVAVQPDGNIVAAGGSGFDGSSAKFALARYFAG